MRFASLTLPLCASVLALAGAAAAQPVDTNTIEGIVIVAPHARLTGPDVQVRSQVVSFADLDLTNRFGARTLLTRVHTAVRQVCAPQANIIELDRTADYQACMRDSLRRALDDVDAAIIGDPG